LEKKERALQLTLDILAVYLTGDIRLSTQEGHSVKKGGKSQVHRKVWKSKSEKGLLFPFGNLSWMIVLGTEMERTGKVVCVMGNLILACGGSKS